MFTTKEKTVLAKIKKWVGTSTERYDFWICGNTWEGGFELSLDTEFRNTYSMQRKVFPSGAVRFEVKQNFV